MMRTFRSTRCARLTRVMRFAVLTPSLALIACAMPYPQDGNAGATPSSTNAVGGAVAGAVGGTSSGATGSASLASMLTYQYLRVDADRTGVANAADDGRYTYIAFVPKPPDDVMFFDADGQPISAARAGAVAALPGLYKGILIRSARQNSYLAPNPRASAADRPPLENDPDVVEARNRLEVATTQLPAFRRAMERADTVAGKPGGASAGAARGPADPVTSSAADARAVRPDVARTSVADDPTYQKTSDGVIVRVFFASGGRAIVRPDDGLRKLEAEAADAQEVRIAGFTDAVGSDAANTTLAQSRAEAIRGLLLKRGVPAEKIVMTWTGGARFLADNATESGRAMNRRVEVLFVRRSRT